ncbi:MAG: hypothetical protein HXY50_14195 [Ignavibacteriaceae bacterium]|nr:hypothetical protein [Ignavibacteriaceae bacterium]
MKLLVLTFFAILSQQLFSQDTTNYQIDLTGKYALQFQVAENFKLTEFQGSIISAKYNLTNALSLRFGISFNSQNHKHNQDNLILDTNEKYISDYEMDNYSVQIKPQLIYSSPIMEDVSFYWGGGFLIMYEKNTENSESSVDTLFSTYVRKSSGFGYGLEAVFGVEWFVKNNISLSGEYGFQLSHIKINTKQTRTENGSNIQNNSDDSYTRGQGNSVRLGISIYF